MHALAVDVAALAEATAISQARLRSMLHGIAVPDINEGFRLAFSLGVELRELGVGVRR